jgi:hypothetical protein
LPNTNGTKYSACGRSLRPRKSFPHLAGCGKTDDQQRSMVF